MSGKRLVIISLEKINVELERAAYCTLLDQLLEPLHIWNPWEKNRRFL